MTVAWVTGGGTGIGRALAQELCKEGVNVVITGRRQQMLDETVKLIHSRSFPGQIMAIAGDALDVHHVEDVVTQVQKQWGPIDLMINNAGVNLDSGQPEATFERYRKSLDLNCLSAIRATEAVLPAMRKMGRGAIVNISSLYGKWSSGQSPSYSVSKYALTGYTDAMRQLLMGTGIHVMGVHPGFIKTAMTLPFVPQGSFKAHLGKTPEQMAMAILKALKHKKRELIYPWYVPWVLRLQRWMPDTMDYVAQHVKR